MNGALVRYDAACKAIAEAKRVDEIKLIRDKSAQVAAAAKVAKDRSMIADATEIQVRAERRLGELLAQAEKNQGAKGVGPIAVHERNRNAPATLASQGIDKKLSSRAQKLAKVEAEDFERAVSAAREIAGEVSATVVLGQQKASKPKPSRWADDDTPVVIPASRPKSEWTQAQEVMEAVERLGGAQISPERVFGALNSWQHPNVTRNLDAAIRFLDQLKEIADANAQAAGQAH